MKMAEMNTELGFDLMEKLLPDVAAILNDEKVKKIKAEMRSDGSIAIGEGMNAVLPLFLGKYRENLIRMAAAISGKSEKEIMEQPMGETLAVFQAGVTDEMLSFFASCLRMVMSA